jgi:serpin B
MTPMLAVNAVYFRVKWREPFNKELTKEANFVLPDGRVRKVMMMRERDEFAYEERNGTQIAALPYRGSMRMIVVLPPKGAEFCKFCLELRGNLGTDWTRRMGCRQSDLQLPRFRMILMWTQAMRCKLWECKEPLMQTWLSSRELLTGPPFS